MEGCQLDAVTECCAGLDVHQETVVACILNGPLEGKPKSIIRTFQTTTRGLLTLGDWLEENRCTSVAMESTGVYWKPIWNLLEGYSFKLLLANAKRIKNVPGRKTDIKDAEWIAKLLRCGLIESSFVPPVEIRELRDITRYRKKIIRDITAEKNRVHKILQDANIKLTTYMSDIFGVSGRTILEMVINGEVVTEEILQASVKGKLRKKVGLLAEAINGRLRNHHRMMLEYSWKHLHYLEEVIRSLELEMEARLVPHEAEVTLIDEIPGVDRIAAATIVAEIGTNMEVFPSPGNLAAWAGVIPGNNESAGKKNEQNLLTVIRH